MLETFVRQVRVELKHLRDVVTKNKLEMLQENGTVVLDTIIKIYAVTRPYTSPFENYASAPLRSALCLLCQPLADLIQLCDSVMLAQDTRILLSKENVENVTKQLHQAVKKVASILLTILKNESNEESSKDVIDSVSKSDTNTVKRRLRYERSSTVPVNGTDQKVILPRKLSDTPMNHKGLIRIPSLKETFLERFSSLSMKFPKDQSPLNSPRIRDHHDEENFVANPALDLEILIRQVRFALKHLRDVIAKQTLDMLPENCSIIVNTITKIRTVVKPFESLAAIYPSSMLDKKESRLCVAVKQLGTLCDNVMLNDIDSVESQNLKFDLITNEVQLAVEDLTSKAFKIMASRATGEFKTTKHSPQLNPDNSSSNEVITLNERNVNDDTSKKCLLSKESIAEIIQNSSRKKLSSKRNSHGKELNSQESEYYNEETKDNQDRYSANSSYSTASSLPLTESDVPSVNSNHSIDSFDMFYSKRLSSDSSSTGLSKSLNEQSNDYSNLSQEDDHYSAAVDKKKDSNYDVSETGGGNIKISLDEVDNMKNLHPEITLSTSPCDEKQMSSQDDQYITYRERQNIEGKISPCPRAHTLIDLPLERLPFEKKIMLPNSTFSVMTYMDMFGKSADTTTTSSEAVRHSEPVFHISYPQPHPLENPSVELSQIIKADMQKDLHFNQQGKQSFTKSESSMEPMKPSNQVNTNSATNHNTSNGYSSFGDSFKPGVQLTDNLSKDNDKKTEHSNNTTLPEQLSCCDEFKNSICKKRDKSASKTANGTSSPVRSKIPPRPPPRWSHLTKSEHNTTVNSSKSSMNLSDSKIVVTKVEDSRISKDSDSKFRNENSAETSNENIENRFSESDTDSCNKHKIQKQSNFSMSTECDEIDATIHEEPTLEPDLILEMDMSPWLEFKNVTEDGPNVKGGPIDAIIVHAIESSKDSLYQEAFFGTYTTFVTPVSLIQKIIRRHSLHMLQGRITKSQDLLTVLMRVLKDLPLAQLDDEIIQIVTKFIYGLICCEDLIMAKALRSVITDKYRKKQLELEQIPSNVEWNFLSSGRKETVLDYSPELIAEQITLLDADLFAKLPDTETLHWAQNQCQEKCPNLARFTEHFNKLSFWVTSRILEQLEVRERERYTHKFIRVMKHLRKIHNFNSTVAIFLALNRTVINRLNKQNNIMDGLEEYKDLVDDSYNFKAYRHALNEALPPCIPLIAMTLKDLTALHNGSPNLLSDGKVNFSKRWQQYIMLDSIRRFRKVSYTFKRHDQILAMFSNFDKIFHEDTMWNMSYHIKPRG